MPGIEDLYAELAAAYGTGENRPGEARNPYKKFRATNPLNALISPISNAVGSAMGFAQPDEADQFGTDAQAMAKFVSGLRGGVSTTDRPVSDIASELLSSLSPEMQDMLFRASQDPRLAGPNVAELFKGRPTGGGTPGVATASPPAGMTPASQDLRSAPPGVAKGTGRSIDQLASQGTAASGAPPSASYGSSTPFGVRQEPFKNFQAARAERGSGASEDELDILRNQLQAGSLDPAGPDPASLPPGVDPQLLSAFSAGIPTSASLPVGSEPAKAAAAEREKLAGVVNIEDSQNGQVFAVPEASVVSLINSDPKRYKKAAGRTSVTSSQIPAPLINQAFTRAAAANTVIGLLGRAESLITDENIGFGANFAQFANDSVSSLTTAGNIFGVRIQEMADLAYPDAVNRMGREAATDLFDPSKTALDLYENSIAFARASARESGKLTDRDIEAAKIGLSDLIASPEALRVKIGEARSEAGAAVRPWLSILGTAMPQTGGLFPNIPSVDTLPLQGGSLSQPAAGGAAPQGPPGSTFVKTTPDGRNVFQLEDGRKIVQKASAR